YVQKGASGDCGRSGNETTTSAHVSLPRWPRLSTATAVPPAGSPVMSPGSYDIVVELHMGPVMTVAPRWKRGRPARSPALVASALLIVASPCGGAGVAGTDSRAELTFTRVNGQRYSVWVANADGSAARKIVSRAY